MDACPAALKPSSPAPQAYTVHSEEAAPLSKGCIVVEATLGFFAFAYPLLIFCCIKTYVVSFERKPSESIPCGWRRAWLLRSPEPSVKFTSRSESACSLNE